MKIHKSARSKWGAQGDTSLFQRKCVDFINREHQQRTKDHLPRNLHFFPFALFIFYFSLNVFYFWIPTMCHRRCWHIYLFMSLISYAYKNLFPRHTKKYITAKYTFQMAAIVVVFLPPTQLVWPNHEDIRMFHEDIRMFLRENYFYPRSPQDYSLLYLLCLTLFSMLFKF